METPQQDPDVQPSEHLIDSTQQVQDQLNHLLDQGNFVAEPEGLFLSAPGNHLQWTDYIDKGCRGGWSEHRQTELDARPLAVTRVEHDAGIRRIDFQVTDGKIDGFVALHTTELPQARFFQKPVEATGNVPSPEAFAGSLDELLHNEPYAYLPDVPARFSDRYRIQLVAKQPLELPVSREPRSFTLKRTPLNENVNGLEVWRNPNGQLLVRTPFDETRSLYRVGKDLMEWLPLDAISFRFTERAPQRVLESRLGRLTAKLLILMQDNSIAGPDKVLGQINDMLATVDAPVTYSSRAMQQATLPFQSRGRSLVVMDAELTQAQEVYASERTLHPYIIADEIKARRAASWVIDREHDLAVPLTEAAFQVKDLSTNDSWYTHLRKLM